MSCRIMYTRNLLQILVCPPVPEEDIHHVRDEMKKMVFNKGYVGKGHQHIIDQYDSGDHDILL